MNLRRTDIIVDRAGWDAAEYRASWVRGRVAWLTKDSPRNLNNAAAVRLVVDGDGSTFSVRALTGGV